MTSPATTPLLVKALKDPKEAIVVGRSLLTNLSEQQLERFQAQAPIQHLISERTNFVDQLLRRVWKHHIPKQSALCLIAVGGYGRGELHPYSDIDILILAPSHDLARDEAQAVESFLTYLWDIGLQVGHAIRTLDDCFTIGRDDVSTATNYIESRWLIGNYEAFDDLRNLLKRPDFWPSVSFFLAKVNEQTIRHNKAQDALAQLEPNIKESPGGLRDIHTIAWVAKRHFGASSLQQLVSVGFLSVEEYSHLERAMRFHWRVRFVLHSLKKRKEERLLFEHQKQVAQALGYTDTTGKLAVESFMQDYYRNARVIRNLNTLLLQHFREHLLAPSQTETVVLDEDFNIINGYLSIANEQALIHSPLNILRLFYLLGTENCAGIRADTQRMIQNYAHLINERFCQQAETWQLFREMLRIPKGVTKLLYAMHTQGILGRLFPAFHRITGLMQFDLFHAYTVDEHTLKVVRNLRQFIVADAQTQKAFPLACELASKIRQPDILLLAGFFHDIAKGRGGKHEILGAEDALAFAQQAHLSFDEGEQLSWLVRAHLEMSHIAQKKDISDVTVIVQFSQTVGTLEKLEHLYLLTVADICATSPVGWNGWKDNLLSHLYRQTRNHLQHQTQENTRNLVLSSVACDQQSKLEHIWQSLESSHYYQKQQLEDLMRHARLFTQNSTLPYIQLESTSANDVCSLSLYTENRADIWLKTTAACESIRLNILEARVYSSNDAHLLIDLKFLHQSHWSESERQDWLEQLTHNLTTDKPFIDNISQLPLPNRQKQFLIPTSIALKPNDHGSFTEFYLSTRDKSGLLFQCAQVFYRHQLSLIAAKISTEGIRADDTFLLVDNHGQAIDREQYDVIKQDLLRALNAGQP
jgi:[protein-PII] uridylyltransferase